MCNSKFIFLFAVLGAALLLPVTSEARSYKPHKHYANEGGHYIGGRGSSHKGGKYINPRTGNHNTRHY